MKKLFISIDIGDDIASYLGSYIRGLSNLDGAKIVLEEKYHITVHYIGYINENSLSEIEGYVGQVTSRSRPFYLRLEKIVSAPPGRVHTMLWAVFEGGGAFAKLSDDLCVALRKFGSDPKGKIPHVTLARSYKPLEGTSRFTDIDIEGMKKLHVDRIALMESVEAQGGVYYKPLRYFSLGK